MKSTPQTKSVIARRTNTRITRSKCGSTAGARNAHACQRRIGNAIAIAAMKLTFTEVVNGSVTPRVTSFLSFGSGPVSHSMMRSWKANVTMKIGMIANSATIRRERNSSRCSTSVASSPWLRRRGSHRRIIAGFSLAHGLALRLRLRLRDGLGGGGRELDLRRRRRGLHRVRVDPAHAVLELAHPLAERAAHLGEALGSEHQEKDDEQDEQLWK